MHRTALPVPPAAPGATQYLLSVVGRLLSDDQTMTIQSNAYRASPGVYLCAFHILDCFLEDHKFGPGRGRALGIRKQNSRVGTTDAPALHWTFSPVYGGRSRKGPIRLFLRYTRGFADIPVTQVKKGFILAPGSATLYARVLNWRYRDLIISDIYSRQGGVFMPNPEIAAVANPQASFIFNRIGPIADWAYLKNIDPGIVKEITLISARAELTAAQTYVKAVEDVVKVVEKSQGRSPTANLAANLILSGHRHGRAFRRLGGPGEPGAPIHHVVPGVQRLPNHSDPLWP